VSASCFWHGAGDSFCAGNDLEDFLKNPMGPGDSPQSRLINAANKFREADCRGGARLRHRRRNHHVDALRFCLRRREREVQVPFINLALVPEFGTSYSIPARIGYLRAAELIQLGQPFDAHRAAELGLVTRVVPDQSLLAMATETAQKLAEKPASALQACKETDEAAYPTSA